jgi:hypothetical protein
MFDSGYGSVPKLALYVKKHFYAGVLKRKGA